MPSSLCLSSGFHPAGTLMSPSPHCVPLWMFLPLCVVSLGPLVPPPPTVPVAGPTLSQTAWRAPKCFYSGA